MRTLEGPPTVLGSMRADLDADARLVNTRLYWGAWVAGFAAGAMAGATATFLVLMG